MASGFTIDAADNVATLLGASDGGPVRLIGQRFGEVVATGAIPMGHKIAIRDIPDGEPVRKFGVVIGAASRAIACGEWVHLHNCSSRYDARSNQFDVDTGVAQDTRYD